MQHLCSQRIRHRQAGIAAIELSLTLLILFMLIFALVAYGALFWAQQALTSVAADTARHAVLQSYARNIDSSAQEEVEAYACTAAQHTPILHAFGSPLSCGDAPGFAMVTVHDACVGAPDRRCLSVVLTLAVDTWPLLNTMHGFANILSSNADAWVPQQLHAAAIVAIAPNRD